LEEKLTKLGLPWSEIVHGGKDYDGHIAASAKLGLHKPPAFAQNPSCAVSLDGSWIGADGDENDTKVA
jgi:hypothetical protein